jgi:pimeloyl-ACP methyl ester carboxylesterase
MHAEANGTRLGLTSTAPALVPDGPAMRERPTVVLLHGGPGGFDHSYFKPDFTPLAKAAQVVYLDLSGMEVFTKLGTSPHWIQIAASDVAAVAVVDGVRKGVTFAEFDFMPPRSA